MVSASGRKSIAQAPFGDDVTRPAGDRLYLLAQPVDVDAQAVFEHLFQGPQAAQEKAGGDGSTTVAHEDVEQFGLGRGEVHRLSLDDGPLVGKVHRQAIIHLRHRVEGVGKVADAA